MKRKVIPFKNKHIHTQQSHSESVHAGSKAVSSDARKVSGDSRSLLANYLKEEAERARTMALLIEVAEIICREDPEENK